MGIDTKLYNLLFWCRMTHWDTDKEGSGYVTPYQNFIKLLQ